MFLCISVAFKMSSSTSDSNLNSSGTILEKIPNTFIWSALNNVGTRVNKKWKLHKIHSLESIDWHVDEIEKMTIAPKIRSMVPNKFQRSVSCYEKNT